MISRGFPSDEGQVGAVDLQDYHIARLASLIPMYAPLNNVSTSYDLHC